MKDEEWKEWTIEEANGTGDYENVLHDTPEDCLFDGIHSGHIARVWAVSYTHLTLPPSDLV